MLNFFKKPAARTFFTEEEGQAIIEAIQQAESRSSGEVRIHLEDHVKGPSVFQRAGQIFQKLKMHETAQRNGVLIYFAVVDHQFAIFADEGINKVVPEGFWDDIVAQMRAHFQKEAFLEGLIEGIKAIGEQLQAYFPREEDDKNELPDDISYG
ncbi:MAG: TPM domain-containing protein [Bacteroidetes bacterium]|nr:MAG: TPM domain-containing protein [Bacteroidota bacterium]